MHRTASYRITLLRIAPHCIKSLVTRSLLKRGATRASQQSLMIAVASQDKTSVPTMLYASASGN